MTFNQNIRRLMPLSAQARKRFAFAGTAVITVGLATACKSDQVLNVNSPDILGTAAFETPTGIDALRFGALSDFAFAYDGNTDAYTVMSGNMADELDATDTFAERLTINARNSQEININMETEYRNMQQAHLGAVNTIRVMNDNKVPNKSQKAEMFIIKGYSEIFFAEGWCSGTPLANEDGSPGTPNTTTALFTLAVQSFDSALANADTSARIKNGASIGRARALLNLGRFADAAAAAATVPRTYQYNTYHSSAATREQNGMWLAEVNGATRYSLVTNEGINGLPYLATMTDPRIPWTTSNRVGFDGQTKNLPTETKFGRTTSGVVGDGTEAALIVLENTLQAGTQAARDAVFAGLNNLRATNSTPIAPIAGSAPTTQDAAVSQLFAERAYWTWLTGHRLGDMRRLVRQYGRNAETVFPTGPVSGPNAGVFGPDVNVQIPFNERNNLNFNGCLDRKA
jgi:hypothetical protein